MGSDPRSGRFSPRAFLLDPVDESLQCAFFSRASQTASWCNTQPWTTYVLSGGAATRLSEALIAEAATHEPTPDFPEPVRYDGVYGQRRRAAGYALYEALGIDRDDRPARHAQLMKNYSFFGAPHTAIVTTSADLGVFGAIDCGAYIGNLLEAIHIEGVQAIAQAAIAMYPEVVRSTLDIPSERLIVCAVSFGYADMSAPENRFRTDRAPVPELVTWLSS